jgi:hypothetical protein
VTQLSPELETIGADLRRAYAARLRRRRVARVATLTGGLAVLCTATAVAATSGDLQLDPSKWSVLGGGSVDDGRGEYVHARNVEDGSSSTFMVEHDAGLDRYEAFLLHERLRAAADGTSPAPVRAEPGPICTRAQLTRAEQTALDALRAGAAPATAVQSAFAGEQCRGLGYGVETAQQVFAGVEPTESLMPGVR